MNTENKKTESTQKSTLVKLKLDVIFKMCFSEHKDLLGGLLEGLLDLPKDSVKNIDIRNVEILPDNINGKFVRMDLNMETGGKLINVEMQQYGTDYPYEDRTLYYWARLYGGELNSGDDYNKLKQSICINIVNHKMFDCEEYHSHFSVMETARHEPLTDKCAIHFFELTKISKTVNKDNLAELWLQLINAETEEDFNMLNDTGVATIQKAVNVVREMSEDERIREMARIREKALHDEVSALNAAERKGIEKTQKKLEPIIEKKDAEVKQLRAEIEALKKQLQQQTKN